MQKQVDMEKAVAKNRASLRKAEVTFQQIEKQMKQGKGIEHSKQEWHSEVFEGAGGGPGGMMNMMKSLQTLGGSQR